MSDESEELWDELCRLLFGTWGGRLFVGIGLLFVAWGFGTDFGGTDQSDPSQSGRWKVRLLYSAIGSNGVALLFGIPGVGFFIAGCVGLIKRVTGRD